MANINRKVASLILLAALDYKEGDRSAASKKLALAAEDPNFDETVDGLNETVDGETDPFLNPEQAGDDDEGEEGEGDGDGPELQLEGLDDLLDSKGENEQASLARNAKRRTTAAEDDKIGGNDGPAGADGDNNSDEEIRQVATTARLRQTRANLLALAKVR